jgi:hypothetical protein
VIGRPYWILCFEVWPLDGILVFWCTFILIFLRLLQRIYIILHCMIINEYEFFPIHLLKQLSVSCNDSLFWKPNPTFVPTIHLYPLKENIFFFIFLCCENLVSFNIQWPNSHFVACVVKTIQFCREISIHTTLKCISRGISELPIGHFSVHSMLKLLKIMLHTVS